MPLAIDKALLRKELDETRDRLAFEQQKSSDLQNLATRLGAVDFQSYDGAEGAWKLLFDYDFFWGLTRLIESFVEDPAAFRAYLIDVGLETLASQVSWDQATNLGRTRFYIAKALRLVRTGAVVDGAAQLEALLSAPNSWPTLNAQALTLVADRSRALLSSSR